MSTNTQLIQAILINDTNKVATLVANGAILGYDDTKSLLQKQPNNLLILELAFKEKWDQALNAIKKHGIDCNILDLLELLHKLCQDKDGNFEKIAIVESDYSNPYFISQYLGYLVRFLLDYNLSTLDENPFWYAIINIFHHNFPEQKANTYGLYGFKETFLSLEGYLKAHPEVTIQQFFDQSVELYHDVAIELALDKGAKVTDQTIRDAYINNRDTSKKQLIGTFLSTHIFKESIKALELQQQKINLTYDEKLDLTQVKENFVQLEDFLVSSLDILHKIESATALYKVTFTNDICNNLSSSKARYNYKISQQQVNLLSKQLSQYRDFFTFHLEHLRNFEKNINDSDESIVIQDSQGIFANLSLSEVFKQFASVIQKINQRIPESWTSKNIDDFCEQVPNAFQEINNDVKPANLSQSKVILDHTKTLNIDLNKDNIISHSKYDLTSDKRPKETIESLYHNINFDIILKYLALSLRDSSHKNNPITIAFTKKDVIHENRKVGGFADKDANIAVRLTEDAQRNEAVFIHEITHAIFRIYNNGNNANPYPNIDWKQKENFDRVMHDSIANLHKLFLPNKKLPSTIQEMAKDLEAIRKSLPTQENQVIATLSSNLFLTDLYNSANYHAEFVVRFNQIIAHFRDLPPHIREALAPIEMDYKYRIIPNLEKEILSHRMQERILDNNYDQFYPETILTLSGEDELKYKKEHNLPLTQNEQNLLNQTLEMQAIIANGTIEQMQNKLANITDERVIRASLTVAINNNREDLCDHLLQAVKATIYLGPQLVLAAKQQMDALVYKLLAAVEEEPSAQYYIAKAAEIMLQHNNRELLSNLLSKIHDSWFLNQSFKIMIEQNKPEDFKSIILDKMFKDLHGRYIIEYVPVSLKMLNNPVTAKFIASDSNNLKSILEHLKEGYKEEEIFTVFSHHLTEKFIGNDVSRFEMLLFLYARSKEKAGYIFSAPKASWNYILEVLEKYSDFINDDPWYLDQITRMHYCRQDVVEAIFSDFGRNLIDKNTSRLEDLKKYLNNSTPEERAMYTGFFKTNEILSFAKLLEPKSKIFMTKSDVFLHLMSHKETQQFIGKNWDLFKIILKLNASEGYLTDALLENEHVRKIIDHQIDNLIILARLDQGEKIIDLLSNDVARAFIDNKLTTLINLLSLEEDKIKLILGLDESQEIFTTSAGTFEAKIGNNTIKSEIQLSIESRINGLLDFTKKILESYQATLSGESLSELGHSPEVALEAIFAGEKGILHFFD